jgi:hypothetical protein
MISKSILEETINLKDTSHICFPTIAQYQKQQQLENDEFEYVHLVYAIQEDNSIVFYIRFINSGKEHRQENFSSYVAQVNKSSFRELLYLVSYYGFFKVGEDNLALFKIINTTMSKTGCYFENSFGSLLYHYQLEQLYCSLNQSNIEEAIAFRKAINLKRQSAFEKAKTIVLPTGESLYDIIFQFRHRDFTLYQKIKEAIALYNYLNT